MTFFYDLNKRLANLANTQLNEGKKAKPDFLDVDKDGNEKESFKKAVADKEKEIEESTSDYSAKKARAGKDIGKPGKQFAKIAADAAERYGSKERGEKVAGAVLKKLRSKTEESELDEARSTGTAFDTEFMKKRREKEAKTGKFDVKDTGYSKRYTRKEEPEADEEEVSDAPKKKGRPKGPAKGPERVTAKAWKHKGSRKVAEGESTVCEYCGHSLVDEVAPPGAKAERMVKGIKKSLSKDGHLSSKDKAIAYATTWKAHNKGQVEEDFDPVANVKQIAQVYMNSVGYTSVDQLEAEDIESIADDAQIGYEDACEILGIELPDSLGPVKSYDEHGDLEEESTEAPKAKKGGVQFGKGVYESMDAKLESMITEGINVAVNATHGTEGQEQNQITITATGDDAIKLAELLNLAGLPAKQEEAGCGCGSNPCSCEQMDEAYGDTDATQNKPDYPTDEETTGEDDAQLRRWAGGLNRPKSTGQTTVPVIASQMTRQSSVQETTDLGMNLYKQLQQFKKN